MKAALVASALAVVLAAGGGTVAASSSSSTPAPTALFASLHVAPDEPAAGYDRERQFGGWAPTGHGCDRRDDALRRDLEPETARGCDVVAGTLRDPYSGVVVSGPSRVLDVDHVVPLALAWRTGAAHWPRARRVALANDLGNLQTTTASTNRGKGDDGPERWLPVTGRCAYAVRFAMVVQRYGLTVSAQRRAALVRACS